MIATGGGRLQLLVRAARPLQQSRSPQFQSDQNVQDGDQRHRHHEEQTGRDLERVLDELELERAHDGLWVVCAVNLGHADHPELDRLRDNTK